MMPIYKARTLIGDMLLSPFEIFIYLPEKVLEEKEERLRRIWSELDDVSPVFDLKFISNETLIGEDPYFQKVFSHCNIFSRILMPRAGDKIGIEIGWIDVFANNEVVVGGNLLKFVCRLCEKDLDQISQVIIDTECFARDSRERDERLVYLQDLEMRFIQIKENIIRHNRSIFWRYIADNRPYRVEVGHDYLADDFEANKQKLKYKGNGPASIQELAALVGFDIPSLTNDGTDNQASIFYDPSISVSVKRLIPGSPLPGLCFGIGSQYVNVPTRSREGIFAYVCTLIRYKNGRSFGKKDISDFLKELKKYSTYKVLDNEETGTHADLFEEEIRKTKQVRTNKIRNYDRGIILFDKMPASLLKKYDWFKKIYDALFRIGRSFGHPEERKFLGDMNFEQWCVHILHDGIRDPFIQGLSNERRDIINRLNEQGYGAIVNQVSLSKRDNKFYINIDPDKIHFPKDDLWEDALSYAGEMNSDFME